MSTQLIEQTVEQIRDWELNAGESFTDYFLDSYSYDDAWLVFLESKGYHDLVQEIKEDVYTMRDGTVLGCTDQQLKFEPYSTAQENDGGPWDEDIYRKDVALWAEFILADVRILNDYRVFLKGDDE
jgi:hypothetical protein